jgi:predicted transcriptional regulator
MLGQDRGRSLDFQPDPQVALFSIHPEWAEAILDGRKRVEFRRVAPNRDVGRVVIYATLPVGGVVGFFTVRGMTVASPSELWSQYGKAGAISRQRFRDYFRSRRNGAAIEVGHVQKLREPLPLSELGTAVPPQSFSYLTDGQFRKVLSRA